MMQVRVKAPVLLRFKSCSAESRICAALQVSYLKSMVYRLSVATLLKYKLPFLDIKIADLSERVSKRIWDLTLLKVQVRVIGARSIAFQVL
jgi:hypothetical protein